MKGTETIKIEQPFEGDGNRIYYVNGGRCSGKVNKTINELVDYINNLQQENQELNQKYLNAVADYETTMAEKNELKKQLEEWEHHLKCSKEMLDIQGQKGNYDYDEYMLGLYNGMEYIIALFETREPNFISGKDVEFTNNKTQQKEFIKYLEDYLKLFDKMDIDAKISYDMLEEILQKYKSIIGVLDENNIK